MPSSSQVRCSLLGQPADDALLGEDQLPGIDLDQVARPQGQHDEKIEGGLPLPAGIARGIVGDREGHDGAGDGDGDGHDQRAEDDVEVGQPKEFGIGRQRELVDDEAGELVDRVEAVQQQGQQRPEIDDAEPEQRRRQQKKEQPAWTAGTGHPTVWRNRPPLAMTTAVLLTPPSPSHAATAGAQWSVSVSPSLKLAKRRRRRDIDLFAIRRDGVEARAGSLIVHGLHRDIDMVILAGRLGAAAQDSRFSPAAGWPSVPDRQRPC